MKVVLATSPHLNHAFFQEGVVPLAADRHKIAQTFAPMGLLSLAGSARDLATFAIRDINKAINGKQLPMSQRFYEATADWLLADDPDLIGFMSEADSYHHLLRICGAIKARKPSVSTLLGGPHASAVHRETIDKFRAAVDFVIRGEGEIAFKELLEGLMRGGLAHVGNLTYFTGGAVRENETLRLIDDLDDLPWPDYSLIELDPNDGLFIEVGRGCPMKCSFCFTAPYWQRKHRIKSPERLIAEFRELRETYGRTDFNLTHDLFTTARNWVLDFCHKLEATGVEITWTCSSRTDTIDEELIEAMASAGCRNIYFGLESGTAVMQARIKKDLDLDWAYYIVDKAVKAGIGVTVGFIAGLPGESESSLHGTLTEGFRYLGLKNSTVHLFGYSPYSGSPVYELIENDLTFDPHFVDFPLGDGVHADNCRLIIGQLDMFSRYTWPSGYEGLDLATLRAAEEFFPIMNAVRPLALALVNRGADPLSMLIAWADWISARNLASGRTGSGLYRGTIEEFLEFAAAFASDHDFADSVLTEMIRWEKLQNVLRTPTAVTAGELTDGEAYELETNPTLMIREFSYAPTFFRDSTPSPAAYGFYWRTDGSPAIVRLRSLAVLLLQLAQEGVAADALVSVLRAGAVDPVPSGAAQVARRAIQELEKQQLLLHRGRA